MHILYLLWAYIQLLWATLRAQRLPCVSMYQFVSIVSGTPKHPSQKHPPEIRISMYARTWSAPRVHHSRSVSVRTPRASMLCTGSSSSKLSISYQSVSSKPTEATAKFRTWCLAQTQRGIWSFAKRFSRQGMTSTRQEINQIVSEIMLHYIRRCASMLYNVSVESWLNILWHGPAGILFRGDIGAQ